MNLSSFEQGFYVCPKFVWIKAITCEPVLRIRSNFFGSGFENTDPDPQFQQIFKLDKTLEYKFCLVNMIRIRKTTAMNNSEFLFLFFRGICLMEDCPVVQQQLQIVLQCSSRLSFSLVAAAYCPPVQQQIVLQFSSNCILSSSVVAD